MSKESAVAEVWSADRRKEYDAMVGELKQLKSQVAKDLKPYHKAKAGLPGAGGGGVSRALGTIGKYKMPLALGAGAVGLGGYMLRKGNRAKVNLPKPPTVPAGARPPTAPTKPSWR